jgi:hypothetical protein
MKRRRWRWGRRLSFPPADCDPFCSLKEKMMDQDRQGGRLRPAGGLRMMRSREGIRFWRFEAVENMAPLRGSVRVCGSRVRRLAPPAMDMASLRLSGGCAGVSGFGGWRSRLRPAGGLRMMRSREGIRFWRFEAVENMAPLRGSVRVCGRVRRLAPPATDMASLRLSEGFR